MVYIYNLFTDNGARTHALTYPGRPLVPRCAPLCPLVPPRAPLCPLVVGGGQLGGTPGERAGGQLGAKII